MGKRHPIGLGHAGRLCQMKEAERLAFLAEGLPVILASAEGFWAAADALRDRPREADVLEGFASEEAAKILILIDMLRCPKRKRSQRIGQFVGWFYDHLARLLYAEAIRWRPVNKGQLREYVDMHRRSHAVDGPVGEYIMPSGPVNERERRLYADVEAFDDGQVMWNAPRSWKEGLPRLAVFEWMPAALHIAQTMQRLGMFTAAGLKIVSETWGGDALLDGMCHSDKNALTQHMLDRLNSDGLIREEATDEDVQRLYHDWPFPMWDFDLREIVVPLDELEAERERNLWREAGY